ncbi:MAG: magnesium transporter [Candidatus Melainabacteria bacterium GWF2_32_7]|nr:MAG: magnesium transporter [Candidatus Melainabacteria bacterium GWF2_32_7]
MLSVCKSDNNTLQKLPDDSIEKGSWINLIKPSGDELRLVAEQTGAPMDLLKAALDAEERSRIEIEEDSILVITNIPIMEGETSFDTLPLGIVITPNHFITICLKDNRVMSYFDKDNTRFFCTAKKARFLFQIQYRSAILYLRYLKYINQQTDEIELNIRRTMKNKALFQLLQLEKSLVYFTTALKDNGIVLQKLMRLRNNRNIQHLLDFDEEDEDLMEDVIIENKQAIEMVEMHSNILSSMMNAFASIISNNLNFVMKFLTTMTILLAVPTMLASFWGMNVTLPWSATPWGFLYVIIFSALITGFTAYILWKKGMF